jgi:hypothetical protein
MQMFEENTQRDVPKITYINCGSEDPTQSNPLQHLDQEGDLCPSSTKTHGCSHVTVPNTFSRWKDEFKWFHRKIGIFITANERDFDTDKSMILFILSYMVEGPAELWANTFMDKAIETGNWGLGQDFLDELARDFGDSEEPRRALEEIGQLYQGKSTAAEYFLKLEQLAGVAEIDVQKSSHILLQIEWSINTVLIDQLYQPEEALKFYHDYKRRIITIDEMRRCHETHKKANLMSRA